MEFELIIRILIMIIIDVIALFGNSLICLSIYKNRRLRGKVGTVILALAVTDFLTATFVAPLTTASFILSLKDKDFRPQWISTNKSDVWCALQGFFLYALSGMSLFSMTMAAVIRFLCVVKPNRYRRCITTKSIVGSLSIMAVIITTIQLALSIPGYGQFQFIWENALCMFVFEERYWHLQIVSEIIFTVIFFALPFAVILVCYTAIFVTVRKHNRRVHLGQTTQATNQCLQSKWKESRKFRKQYENQNWVNSFEVGDNNTIQRNSQTESQERVENEYKLSHNKEDPSAKERKVNKILENTKIKSMKDYKRDQATNEAMSLTLFQANSNKSTEIPKARSNESKLDDKSVPHISLIEIHDAPIDRLDISNLIQISARYKYNRVQQQSFQNGEDVTHITPVSLDPVKPVSLNPVTPESLDPVKPVSLELLKPVRPDPVPKFRKKTDSQHLQDKPVAGHAEAKVTKTMLAVFVGFICSWIPAGIYFIISFYVDYAERTPYAIVIPICSILPSAVNPFIYGAMDRRFRRTYKQVLRCADF